jgi:hypothetical protein
MVFLRKSETEVLYLFLSFMSHPPSTLQLFILEKNICSTEHKLRRSRLRNFLFPLSVQVPQYSYDNIPKLSKPYAEQPASKFLILTNSAHLKQLQNTLTMEYLE